MTDEETVTVGELRVQFTARGEAAEGEIEEFIEEVQRQMSSLETARAVMESNTFSDFNARLAWGWEPDSRRDRDLGDDR